jgi:hypothetical protein
MKVKSNLFSIFHKPDSLLAAIAGFFLIQLFFRHSGIGISPDSVTYLSAARNMIQGNGFRSFDNLPVVDFPFAYPFLLTIISFFTRLDPLQFGCVLNGLLFGLLLYVSGGIMNGFQKSSGWYKRIILAGILLSPAIQEVYTLLWSETLFLLLILLFIVSMANYLRHSTIRWLLISILLCAFACLTRYAGVFLVIAGSGIILLNQENNWRKRLSHSMLFTILSVSLLFVNIIRNRMLTGFATGPRPKSDTGIWKIMENFGGVLCDWLLINRTTGVAIFLTIVVLLVFVLTILHVQSRHKSNYKFEYIMAFTGLVYCLFMLATAKLTRYEQFTNRLLSPMFILLICSLTWWIPGFLARQSYRMKWVYGLPVLILAAWFLNIQMAADYEYYDGVKDAGVPGYQEDSFVQSEIVNYLKENTGILNHGYEVYSNAGDAFYFVTRHPARQLPFNAFPDRVRQYYASGNNYLVWFNDLENPEMPDLNSILKNKNMVLLKQLPDGAVYITK